MSDTNSDPGHIESELDQTRSRLGDHLSELQNRLSPGQVVDDVMSYFRGTDGADFGRHLIASARANPLPVALTGIGLVWLMASRPRARQPENVAMVYGVEYTTEADLYSDSSLVTAEDYGAALRRARDAEMGIERAPDETEHSHRGRLDEARGHAMGMMKNAKETAESFGQRVSDAIAAAERAMTGTAQTVRESLGGAADSARDAGQRVSRAVSRGRESGSAMVAAAVDNPVLLGSVGLAVGVLLGALLPQSDQEEAALGGVASQARDTATSLAKEGVERGKQMVGSVVQEGRQSVQAHGLAGQRSPGELVDAALGGDLASDAKAVAEDLLKASENAVRQGASPKA